MNAHMSWILTFLNVAYFFVSPDGGSDDSGAADVWDGDVCTFTYKDSACTDADCNYKVIYTYNKASGEVMFTVQAKQDKGTWAGIAFGPEKEMVSSSYICAAHICDHVLQLYNYLEEESTY